MPSAKRDPLVDSVVEQFLLLSHSRQLAVYRAIRAHLSTRVAEDARDKKIHERKTAIDALARAAEILQLPAKQAPTTADYERARAIDGSLPARHHLIKAYGRWRWAQDAYLGALPSGPDIVIAPRRVARAEPTVPALAAITEWLGTNPRGLSAASYDDWARRRNDVLVPGERRYPSHQQVERRLELPWAGLKASARGEEVIRQPSGGGTKRTLFAGDGGPHRLVGSNEAREILKISRMEWLRLKTSPTFPVVVLTSGTRMELWYRDDIEAFGRGERVPERAPNELASVYYTTMELADAIERPRRTIYYHPHLPKPAFVTGGCGFYLRAEVRDWVETELRRRRVREQKRRAGGRV